MRITPEDIPGISYELIQSGILYVMATMKTAAVRRRTTMVFWSGPPGSGIGDQKPTRGLRKNICPTSIFLETITADVVG